MTIYWQVYTNGKYLPEKGCRLYLNRFPFMRSFFGTGGSDVRRTDESLLFSAVLICTFTCFCKAIYFRRAENKNEKINDVAWQTT